MGISIELPITISHQLIKKNMTMHAYTKLRLSYASISGVAYIHVMNEYVSVIHNHPRVCRVGTDVSIAL